MLIASALGWFLLAAEPPIPKRPSESAPSKPVTPVAAVAPVSAVAPMTAERSRATMKAAFLFGVSVPRKRPPGDEPRFGVDDERIDWWLGDPDGSNLRLLDNPDGGRVACEPIDRTIILKRTENDITLLGPDGGNLTLSLKDGPLAEAKIHKSGTRTTFAIGPERKSVWFVNGADRICRIDLPTKRLETFAPGHVNAADGVSFSPDGATILYSAYIDGVHSIWAASADKAAKPVPLADSNSGFTVARGFLPNGRVAIASRTAVRSFDPATGDSLPLAGPWPEPLKIRSNGGFSPDGTRFTFDRGGPYVLDLFLVEVSTGNVTTVKENYLESFEEMVWVRLSNDDRIRKLGVEPTR
jgi:WD40 repeat protein